jgi:tripartite-type tricarboxylate transporter receptor subunit TctC
LHGPSLKAGRVTGLRARADRFRIAAPDIFAHAALPKYDREAAMTIAALKRLAYAAAALIAGLTAGLARDAAAQSDPAANYPNRFIRLVVGFGPGGGNDIIARIVSEKLQARLGQPVIVENKPGAGGSLAALAVKAAPPDGYTLLLGASGAMSVTPAISVRPPYATLKDFTPVTNLASFPLLLSVYAAHPAQDLPELVAWMKANPDRSNYATSSAAFTLATELFKQRSGAPATAIPYKSSGESIIAVISRQAVFTISDPFPAIPQVKSGLVRALAVTAATRLPDLPEVPTLAEGGVTGADVGLWTGVFAPAGTPPAVVRRLETELRAIMQIPDVKEKFRALATPTVGSTAAEFADLIGAETKMWSEVGRAANVKLE